MREPANNQHGGVKRFTYNGPNSKTNPKDNSAGMDDWFSGHPTKAKSEQSLLHSASSKLDDVWSIRKNVSASQSQQQVDASTHLSNTGFYSRHGQYNKSSKLNEDASSPSGSGGFGKSGSYSYGQSKSSYSYAGGAGPGQGTSPRFGAGPNSTQGPGRAGIGLPPLSRSRSPNRSIGGNTQASQHGRGKTSDTWSSF